MTHGESRGCPRVLCIVAAPRTGSNVLCSMFSRDPACHYQWELFHPHWIGGLNEDELAALAARANSVEAIASWRARQPGAVIDLLLGLSPCRTLVLKVFPGHVRRRLLRHEVFGRGDIAFTVLTRHPIDSFVSATKARILRAHSRVDTTTLRPTLSLEDFGRWARSRYNWYRWIDYSFKQACVDPIRIDYDRAIAVDPAATAAHLATRIGLKFAPPSRNPKDLFRQDKTEDYRDRVANWNAFTEAVDPQLLAWAVADSPEQPGLDI